MKDQELQELTELRQEVARLKAIEAKYTALTQKTNGKPAAASALLAKPDGQPGHDFRKILEVVPIPMFISRLADGLITFANKSVGELVGIAAEELLGRSTPDFYVDPHDRQFVVDVVQRDGHLYHHELHLKRADGSEFWALVSLQALEFEGEPSVYAGLYDITDRKHVETNLRRSEAQFRAILNAMPDLIFSVRRDGTVMDLRGGHDATLYKTEAEIVGKKIPDILPPDLAEQRLYYLEQAFQTGELQFFEFDIETNNGRRHEEGRFIVANQDEAVHIIRDVTDRARAEAALAKRATALEAVAWVSAAVSSILDTDQLLQQVADLTKDQFGLYHAHIYLLNNAGDALDLAAGAGEVGAKMVAQGWSIPLHNQKSLVAQAARTREGVIVNNVRQAPDWLPNELLPATQAEMAVPIIVGEVMLGVLDVQSDQVDYFTAEDVSIQTTLAAQIGIALQNAATFARQQETSWLLQERVKELDCLNDIGREILDSPPIPDFLNWVARRIPQAMQHPEVCAAAIEYDDRLYGNPAALDMPAKIVNGLRVTGQLVGRIHIAYAEPRPFLDEESAMLGGIASRVGGYIENQRLVTQIQERATELEDTTHFLNSVLDNIPSGLFVKDAENLAFVRFNKAFEELTGFKLAEVIGKTDFDFFPEDEAEFFVAKDREVLNNAELVDIPEEPIHTASQGVRYLHTRKVPIMGLDGQPRYLLGISEDITERKRIEEALRENEVRLSEATSIAQLGYWELDFQTQMFTFTDQLYALLRTTAVDEGGYQMPVMQYAQKFVHPDDANVVGAEIQKAVETTDPHYSAQIEHRIIRADGSEGFILVRFRVIKDAQGRTIKSVGANQDITERKQAEFEREQLLAEVQAAYRQYVRREWEQYLADKYQGNWQIEVAQPGVNPAEPAQTALQVPIALRGQSIGTLTLQDVAGERNWTEDEKALIAAVTEQLALTVENLRLFENTQQRAVREQLTREITDKMRAAPDVDSIIQTGLSELARTLGVSRTYVKLTPDRDQSGR